MRELFGKTADGYEVYLDLEKSHAVTHIEHHPKLRAAAEKVIASLEGGPEWIRVDRDTGEEVGTTDLIETKEGDEIIYAKRPRRATYSRFVKGKSSYPTTWITVVLHKTGERVYTLYTTFVGRNVPSFPGGDYLPEQSKDFWSRHALVWESQEIVPGTETTQCPW